MITNGERRALTRLVDCAREQYGYLTIRQVRQAGVHDSQIGRLFLSRDIERIRGGIYRLTSFPPSPEGVLVAAILWPTVRTPPFRGVISHETALALHGMAPMG